MMIKTLQKGARYTSRVVQHFVEQAALKGFDQLPQHSASRSYWHDPTRHALVGLHLGIDLHRHDGRYHVLETNLGAMLRPERRELYDAPLDPIISGLVGEAKSRGFERLVFLSRGSFDRYKKEFQFASGQSGLEVSSLNQSTPPERFSANTMYVAHDLFSSPICTFVHDKYWSAKWLKETIDSQADRLRLLTYVPTFDHLVLPEEPSNPGRPNLVIKLSSKDRGEAVVFGRFRSREEAKEALQLPKHNLRAMPGVFNIKWHNRLFSKTIYQTFVEPEVLDNRPSTIRLHSFVSPIFDIFLSAHARIGRIELPIKWRKDWSRGIILS
jgi:hypothetical protein